MSWTILLCSSLLSYHGYKAMGSINHASKTLSQNKLFHFISWLLQVFIAITENWLAWNTLVFFLFCFSFSKKPIPVKNTTFFSNIYICLQDNIFSYPRSLGKCINITRIIYSLIHISMSFCEIGIVISPRNSNTNKAGSWLLRIALWGLERWLNR